MVAPDAVDLVERLVWHHDQPFGDSSAIPTFLLSEVTRRHVTVALSGDGGDELFAGYERFAAGLAARRYAALPGVVQRRGRGVLDLLPAGSLRGRAGSLQRFARVAELGLPDAYRSWISYVPDDERAALLNGSRDDWGLEDYRATWRGSEGARTARPAPGSQPPHVSPRRSAREGRPDEHGAWPGGALALPGH